MAGIIFTRYGSPQDEAKEPPRWSRRSLLSSALGLGAAATMTGQAVAQHRPYDVETTSQVATPASPEATPDDGAETGLASILAAIPLSTAEDAADDALWFMYANLMTHWKAMGVTPPTSMSLDDVDFHLAQAASTMALDSQAFQHASREEFVNELGFQPFTVHETLTLGQPPNRFDMFYGGIDLEALPAAWEAAGFEPVTTEHNAEVWTVGPDGEPGTDNTVSHLTVGGMNNVALLDSGHVVFTRHLDNLESLLAAAAEGDATLAEQPSIAAMLPTLPEDAMSIVALDGSTISRESGFLADEDAEDLPEEAFARFDESDDAVGPMPPLGMMMIGAAGAPFFADEDADATPTVADVPEDAGHMFARLESMSADEAAQAADVVAYRWETWSTLRTRAPYTDFGEIARARADEAVTVLDFAPAPSTLAWLQLVVYGHDLAIFAE